MGFGSGFGFGFLERLGFRYLVVYVELIVRLEVNFFFVDFGAVPKRIIYSPCT